MILTEEQLNQLTNDEMRQWVGTGYIPARFYPTDPPSVVPVATDPQTESALIENAARLAQELRDLDKDKPAPVPARPDLVLAADPMPSLNYGDLMAKSKDRKCPKCGAFVETVITDTDRRPGAYCNKKGCGWAGSLPGTLVLERSIENTLSPSLIELIRVAPLNEEVRAIVLSELNKPVPRWCKTYDEISWWVAALETVAMHQSREGDGNPFTNPFSATTPLRTRPVLQVDVDYSFRECGTCNYNCLQSGSGTYEISQADLVELCDGAHTWSDLVRRVKNEVCEMVNNSPPDTEGSNYRHENYDSDDTDDQDATMSNSEILNRLQRFLRTHNPRLAATLDDTAF